MRETPEMAAHRIFTKENFARLTAEERGELMQLQMSRGGGVYGGGGYLPEDCSECGACGEPMLGSGWCEHCYSQWDWLIRKATKENAAMVLGGLA